MLELLNSTLALLLRQHKSTEFLITKYIEMDPEAQYKYLLSLESVRSSAKYAYKAAQLGQLHSFDFHPDKLDSTSEFVCSIITVSVIT